MSPLRRLRVFRWGMAARIVCSIVLLFGLFAAAVGVWVAQLTKGIFLSETRDRVVALDQTVQRHAFENWDVAAQLLGNPVWSARVKPLVDAGNFDAVTRALREVAARTGLHVIHAYDDKLALVGTSTEAAAGLEPPFLKNFAKGLANQKTPTVQLLVLPADVVRFEGLAALAPPTPAGRILAMVATAPLLDDFNEPVGYLVGFRLLNGDRETVEKLASASGADITLVLDGVRVSTTLLDGKGKNLTGSRVTPSRTALTREDLGHGPYLSHQHALSSRNGEPGAVLTVSVPLSDLLRRSTAIRHKVLAAGLTALAVFAFGLTVLIRRSLRAVPVMLEYMGEVSGGRLGARLDVRTGDELESLAGGINDTVSKLRDLVADVETSFRQVESVSGRLVGTAESLSERALAESEVIVSLDETTGALTDVVERVDAETSNMRASTKDNLSSLTDLASSVSDMAAGAERLADSSRETATAMEEMAASVSASASNVTSLSELINQGATTMGQVDEAVRRISELTDRTKELARRVSDDASVEGRSAMERAKREMDDTRRRVDVLGQTVKAVGQRSSQIGEIITLISGIADKTKLLALNAAILAAQAGENGQGFAVVAAQIRELSDQTNASAKKVAGLIASVQHESSQAVKEAHLGAEAVTKSTDEVTRVAAVLERIIEGAGQTKDLTGKIAAQTEEQAAASSQVAVSLQEVASMAQQLAAAALEQDRTSRHVLSIAEQMGGKASEMKAASREQAHKVENIKGKVAATASVADHLGASASSTKTATAVLRDSVDFIRQVVEENQERATALQESIDLLSSQSEQVRKKLSSFVLT